MEGPKAYWEPSFSWASVRNSSQHKVHIEIPSHTTTCAAQASCVRYRNHDILTEGGRASWKDEPIVHDIFGPILSPHVELRLTRRVIPETIGLFEGPRGEPENETFSKQPRLISIEGRIEENLEFADGSHRMDYALPVVESSAPERIYYYMIAQREIEDRGGDYFIPEPHTWVNWRALVLKIEDAQTGRFRRVGLLEAHRLSEMQFYDKDWDHEREVPSWWYDEITGEHTLYVV